MDGIKEEVQDKTESISPQDKIGNSQFYELVTGKEVNWQSIIYDLINTEQLDPWDIDISLLAKKYTEKIRELEETNFFVSSKVLLAAAILLRLKSDFLLHKYLKNIDEILFGKKQETSRPIERIELDEDDLPKIYPKTPLPRYKKVSLQELIDSLNKAMSTENRRIKKRVERIQQERETEIVLPKSRISLKDKIKKIYSLILTNFGKKQKKLSYSSIAGNSKESRLSCFLPVLHLDSQHKIFLEQESHFDEIWIWLYKHYRNLNPIKEEEDDETEEISDKTGFDNPLANFFDTQSEIINEKF
ncbi:MAG: segregation/condensation protein A [Nanoarchaeota archaeon]|nr:segregation/condensation protein A [Nanoarchaeota archaeon]